MRPLLLLLLSTFPLFAQTKTIRVGSKKFTESVLLGEMATLLFRGSGFDAEHRKELGGTQILWKALLNGDIDVYPEYTGTIRSDILKSDDDIETALGTFGIRVSRSMGFNNSYALGMQRAEAKKRNIFRISDLSKHSDLRFGFSEEFANRADGWRPLARRYRLDVPSVSVRVLDHDLAVRALRDGILDVTDVYTTEGAIKTFDLLALEDDLHFFPKYEAVWLYRSDLPKPALEVLSQFAYRFTEQSMAELNASAMSGTRETVVAEGFLREHINPAVTAHIETLGEAILRRTSEHLRLVLLSLLAAILVAVPLGILAARKPLLGQIILFATGILQTIPSLALLAALVPLLRLGVWPAVAALFLYSLLPIVRNTYTGLRDISPTLLESARALGLPPSAILRRVELPLASRSILAGIKTAAVINVGTATLGFLVGAGGYGQPIFEGIRIDSTARLMEGAIPAAVLALLVLAFFEGMERIVTPRGLRVTS